MEDFKNNFISLMYEVKLVIPDKSSADQLTWCLDHSVRFLSDTVKLELSDSKGGITEFGKSLWRDIFRENVDLLYHGEIQEDVGFKLEPLNHEPSREELLEEEILKEEIIKEVLTELPSISEPLKEELTEALVIPEPLKEELTEAHVIPEPLKEELTEAPVIPELLKEETEEDLEESTPEESTPEESTPEEPKKRGRKPKTKLP